MSLIELKKISKLYESEGEQVAALQELTVSVESGEFVAIMGPSGSGKSTLLHLLGFLDDYTTGSYIFEGREAKSYAGDEVARIRNKKLGFVFQSFNLLPHTTVFENVKLPLLYSDIPEATWGALAEKAIEAVGLSHRRDFDATQLSGGEKQRAAIARALVCSPSVIFADEPTGNLDSKSGGAVMDILKKLNEVDGHTIILITHETDTARHARRIIRIKDGMIESDTVVAKEHRANGNTLNKID